MFEEFVYMLGFRINIVKFMVFFGGRGKDLFENKVVVVGLFIFVLFIKYFGLFFISKIMSMSDYEFLVLKIRNRFFFCFSKVFFYVGRLLFIKLVIVSIINFYCSVFCIL